jgi:cation:H+ antiporter
LALIILVMSGDFLVKGAVALSDRLGIPAFIVGLTIVAFGTSAPELLISIQAVLSGVPGIAIGNVVGSNTANILMVLGLPALMFGLDAAQTDLRKNYALMIGGSLLFIYLASLGVFSYGSGMILLTALAVVLGLALRDALQEPMRAEAAEIGLEGGGAQDVVLPAWKITGLIGIGLLGLPYGANLLVNNATEIARSYQISETTIGLTLVALGTSLPELATTLASAIRRQADVALGNVIGSNVFNLLAIMGVTAFVGPIPVSPQLLSVDLWVMLAASLSLAPFVVYRLRINRLVGALLTAAYLVYVWLVVM